ncbi:MAG: response regulator transcription factor [Thermoleophilia bacterium]|jgi:two-component system nitrate/nitrite response regulator NarL|nr:response regulator transcription factor [Thermoleophilia bacterium]
MPVVRVLLVDDNAQFRSLLRRLLDRDPEIAVVAEAGDGTEVLDAAGDAQPDVVVMDVSMPGMDGISATYALKERFPDITVLMLSVGDKTHELAAGLAGGAAEFLPKGVRTDEIVAAIKRHSHLGEPA